MTLLALAFFITANTAPVEPGPHRYGSTTSVVLYDAPSQETAQEWGKGYVERMLLNGHPDQKLTELRVILLHDRLLTSTGEKPIEWPSLVEYAKAAERYGDRSSEVGSSMVLMVNPKQMTAAPIKPEAYDVESIKKHVPDADIWNWDETKQCYYVLHRDNDAFVVRSMNMLLAGSVFVKSMGEKVEEKQRVLISSWPGADKYQK